MGEKYLNENTARFKCNQSVGMARFQCRESGNSKAVEQGKGKLLTEQAKIKMPVGMCNLLRAPNGMPLPCRCQLTQWQNLSKNTADKKKLLTEKSKNNCIIGGIISLANVSSHAEISNNSTSLAAMPLFWPIWETFTSQEKKQSVILSPVQTEQKSLPNAMQGAVSKLGRDITGDLQIQAQMLCSVGSGYCKKKKMQNCPYYQLCLQRTIPAVHNDSQKLAQNYQQKTQSLAKRDKVDQQFYALQKDWPVAPWSYAAHHIISGNQVFARNLRILQLAAFLQYDINRAENCIYLISKPEDYGAIPREYRNVSAYDMMSLSKMQWHVGGHQYSFSTIERQALCTGLKKYLRRDIVNVDCYANLLSRDLQKLEKKIYAYAQKNSCCWQENSQLCHAFVKEMDALSKKVKFSLGTFTQQPQASYPYYVSREAYLYAFSLPKTGKIIIMFMNSSQTGKILLRKYRVTHGQNAHGRKQGFLIYTPISDDVLGYQDYCLDIQNNSKDQRRECIRFCNNITHFVIFAPAQVEYLPFTQHIEAIDLRQDIWQEDLEDIEGVLSRDDVQIQLSVWLRDTADANYIAPQRMIRERLSV